MISMNYLVSLVLYFGWRTNSVDVISINKEHNMLEENARIFLSVDISILLDGSISFGYLFFSVYGSLRR